MDMSKLPRLSQTPGTPAGPSNPAAADPGFGLAPAADVGPAGTDPAAQGRGAFCPQCGAKVPAGSKFCAGCGADVRALGRPSPAAPYPSPAAPYPSPDARDGLSPGFAMVAETWFFAVLGLLLMLWGGTYVKYHAARMRGQSIETGVTWGNADPARHGYDEKVEYPDLQSHQMWTDASIFYFGLALLAGALTRGLALTRLGGKRAILLAGLVFTLFAVGYNLYMGMKLFTATPSTVPLFQLLFVAFGGYLLYEQWVTIQWVRTTGSLRARE